MPQEGALIGVPDLSSGISSCYSAVNDEKAEDEAPLKSRYSCASV